MRSILLLILMCVSAAFVSAIRKKPAAQAGVAEKVQIAVPGNASAIR